MALPETSNVNPEKPITESNKHEKRGDKPSTKVVVRRLPPSMTKEAFLTQVSPIPDYDYMYNVKGDLSLGENAFSRVYINFANTEDIFMFKEKFDNYVFVDNKGHEYAAVVEFAAFQKIPKKRGKPRPDPKVGSIESDPLYIEFLESLKEQPNKDEKPEFSYQPSNENKNDESTPLLDYIKQRKIDRLKSREEKREERRKRDIERRKRDIERRKQRDEERKKRYEEKSPAKTVSIKLNTTQNKSDTTGIEKVVDKEIKSKETEKIDSEKSDKTVEKPEKNSDKQSPGTFKNKERKHEEFRTNIKPKPKYPLRSDKFESYDRKDFKSRRDEYKEKERRGKYDDYRKDDYKKDDHKKEQELKQYPKKVKKYSERREERKIEAKKAEQKKELMSKNEETIDVAHKEIEIDNVKSINSDSSSFERSNSEDNKSAVSAKELVKKPSVKESDKEEYKSDDQERDKSKNKENDPRMQRRIRNKDRPTMQIYQPGMLSKRRNVDDEKDTKETTSLKE